MKYVRAKTLRDAEKEVAKIVKRRNAWHVKKEAVGNVKLANSKVTVDGEYAYKYTTRSRKK